MQRTRENVTILQVDTVQMVDTPCRFCGRPIAHNPNAFAGVPTVCSRHRSDLEEVFPGAYQQAGDGYVLFLDDQEVDQRARRDGVYDWSSLVDADNGRWGGGR